MARCSGGDRRAVRHRFRASTSGGPRDRCQNGDDQPQHVAAVGQHVLLPPPCGRASRSVAACRSRPSAGQRPPRRPSAGQPFTLPSVTIVIAPLSVGVAPIPSRAGLRLDAVGRAANRRGGDADGAVHGLGKDASPCPSGCPAAPVPVTRPAVELMVTLLPTGLFAIALMPVAPVTGPPVVMLTSPASARMPVPLRSLSPRPWSES